MDPPAGRGLPPHVARSPRHVNSVPSHLALGPRALRTLFKLHPPHYEDGGFTAPQIGNYRKEVSPRVICPPVPSGHPLLPPPLSPPARRGRAVAPSQRVWETGGGKADVGTGRVAGRGRRALDAHTCMYTHTQSRQLSQNQTTGRWRASLGSLWPP